jgi:hypothetical protein
MVANPRMMITSNKNRSGFLLRGAGIGGVGPYRGTPPPKDCRPKLGGG